MTKEGGREELVASGAAWRALPSSASHSARWRRLSDGSPKPDTRACRLPSTSTCPTERSLPVMRESDTDTDTGTDTDTDTDIDTGTGIA